MVGNRVDRDIVEYHKILIISPRLIFVWWANFWGSLFSEGLYWKEFCISRWVIGRIFASEIWGAYFWEGLFLRGRRLLSEFYDISFVLWDALQEHLLMLQL